MKHLKSVYSPLQAVLCSSFLFWASSSGLGAWGFWAVYSSSRATLPVLGSKPQVLLLPRYDQCLCAVFQYSFSNPLVGFLDFSYFFNQSMLHTMQGFLLPWCLLLLSLLLLTEFLLPEVFSDPRGHLPDLHLMFVVSSWIVTWTLTSPQHPSFCLVYNLWSLHLRCNPPRIVKNFLVLISVASISSFGQFIRPVQYLMTSRT